ncbi:MAG: hypothetical protein DHS20C05_00540 [Hyphococcus sp.]|nr:MAG: hypothetical protein DHS20C05_00540 [Marinicaulis sp.]
MNAAEDEAVNAEKFAFDHVSCIGAKNEIRVIVSGVKDSIGLITADLYPNDQEAFLKGPLRVSQVKFAARSPMTKFCIRAPESGSYAVALYHDENANGGFDKGAFGMPAEPWGISNNPKVRFAAPPVEKALFSVDGSGAKLEIELN